MDFYKTFALKRRLESSTVEKIPQRWFLVRKLCERVFGTWRNGHFSAFSDRFDWFSESSALKRPFHHVPKTLPQTFCTKNCPAVFSQQFRTQAFFSEQFFGKNLQQNYAVPINACITPYKKPINYRRIIRSVISPCS